MIENVLGTGSFYDKKAFLIDSFYDEKTLLEHSQHDNKSF